MVILSRIDHEKRESIELAPYAIKSAQTKGRHYLEAEDAQRTAFQRDHDRIVHSSAYRRLGNKTQVFVSFEGEQYRTRLTHTEETTQIAVAIARALGANTDLTAAISRAHDLGHPPFGHAGEEALKHKMAAYGGFEHNTQTIRIVEELELEYTEFAGLNLTAEVRDGVFAHGGAASTVTTMPSIEAQIANIADEIAYSCHDLEDGLASGLLSRDDLAALAPRWWQEARAAAYRRGATAAEFERRRVKGYLIDRLVSDLISATGDQLTRTEIRSPEMVQLHPFEVVDFTDEVRAMRDDLYHYLFDNLYRHFEVVTMGEKAKRLLSDVFSAYVDNPDQLPLAIRSRVTESTSYHRVICDHISLMTDRGALREHQRLFDVTTLIL